MPILSFTGKKERMANRKSRSYLHEQLAEGLAERKASSNPKRIRRVNPLGLRVVVRICKESNTTDGGLYLPEGAKEATLDSILAEVIEVASAVDSHTDEETNVSGIPLSAMVLIPKSAGVKVPWDEALRVASTWGVGTCTPLPDSVVVALE